MANLTVANRRKTDRHNLRIPLHLRVRGSLDPGQMTESVDISERGALVETDLPLRVGWVVDLQIVFLGEITGEQTTEWHCRGRVVRTVDPNGKARMKAGVRFEQLGILRVAGRQSRGVWEKVALAQGQPQLQAET